MKHSSLTVTAPARLHLGFLDLEGGLGRRFASIGVALEEPRTRVRVSPGHRLEISGPEAARGRRYLQTLGRHFGFEPNLRVDIETVIPAHSGLGSGTQLALALGTAVTRLFEVESSPEELASILGRGARSGIGVGAFAEGGVLVDGGRGPGRAPPPILSRFPFPEDWRVLVVFDRDRAGVHGEAEVAGFENLPPFPADRAAHLCRLALMVALPALAESDIDRFGAAVAEIQRAVGDHFAPVQGGRFASPDVAQVLAWLVSEGITGVGQSSWGPTGFALIGSAAEAKRLQGAARRRWIGSPGLSFEVRRGRNCGAAVEISDCVLAAGAV